MRPFPQWLWLGLRQAFRERNAEHAKAYNKLWRDILEEDRKAYAKANT